MKRLNFLFITPFVILISWIFITCCSREEPLIEETNCDTCENFQEAFVFGFDPCSTNPDTGSSAGYLMAVPAKGDTVMTYNFPDSLDQFPKEYFTNYQFMHYFPDSARENFQIKLKYRFASEEEMNWYVCRGDIITPKLKYLENQIIILSIAK